MNLNEKLKNKMKLKNKSRSKRKSKLKSGERIKRPISTRSESSLRGALINDTDNESISEEKDTFSNTNDIDDYQLARALDLIQGISLYRTKTD